MRGVRLAGSSQWFHTEPQRIRTQRSISRPILVAAGGRRRTTILRTRGRACRAKPRKRSFGSVRFLRCPRQPETEPNGDVLLRHGANPFLAHGEALLGLSSTSRNYLLHVEGLRLQPFNEFRKSISKWRIWTLEGPNPATEESDKESNHMSAGQKRAPKNRALANGNNTQIGTSLATWEHGVF